MNKTGQLFTFEEMAELERRRQVAASLSGTLELLNSDQPLDTILDHIVRQACQLMNADAAAVYHLQPDGKLVIQSFVGLSTDYIQFANIPLGKLATGRAAFLKRAINIQDTRHLYEATNLDDELRNALRTLARNYRSIIANPIDIREESYGSLTLYYSQTHKITEEDADLVKDFSTQAALAIDNARLRLRTQQDAIVQERNRLARELHDSVTQTLFSANLIASSLPTVLKRDPQKGEEGLNELSLLTRGALAEMRSLLLELRPQSLQNAYLDDLITQLKNAAEGRLRKPVLFTSACHYRLPEKVTFAFYRITQEALNNIIKHAGANQVEIDLQCELLPDDRVDQVRLSITDDGCGFEDWQTGAGHLGFNIMNERAAMIGALLTIESQVDCGTRIQILWHKEETQP